MPDFKPWEWAVILGSLAVLNIVVLGGLIIVISTYDLWASPTYLAAEPTVPPWATPTATQRPTFTATFTPQVWPTATPSRTPTRTPPATPTWTPLPTRTPQPTRTPTPYRPPTDTPIPTPTRTRVPTRTPLPTFTSTPQPDFNQASTPYDRPTDTPTPTPTRTRPPTITHTPQPTATRTPTPTVTPLTTITPLSTPTPATNRGLPSPTPSRIAGVARLSNTATPSPSPTRTSSPTPSPSLTHTPTPSPSPTATITPSPTPTATASPASGLKLDRLEAIPEAEHSISLSWEPIAQAITYRIYSDMGTGYGVYLFKAETEENAFADTSLRSGSRHQYRVASVTRTGEKAIARATVVTSDRPISQAKGEIQIASASNTSPLAAPRPSPSPVRVTPAPTPLPPDTIILGLLSATDYADDFEDTLTIVGEVRNDSHLDVGEAIVTATFYDTNGQVIGEASGPTILRAMLPGVRSPFAITLPRPTGLANYSLRATARPISMATANAKLNVVNTRRFEDSAGFYHVAGVIENLSNQRVKQARVIVTLYDRGGRVVNVGFSYPQPSSLSPSDRADFDVTFTYYPKVFSHLAIAMED